MADNLLFEQSSESQIQTEPFVSRQVVYVVDQNNGSYNGQIQLDTSSLSNSGKYASYSEAYLEIPIVYAIHNTAGVANFGNATGAFTAGLKAGYWHLLHSFSVEYNNTSVVQLTPFSNMYIHYKMMTSMSQEDVSKIGAGLGFFPDTSTSFLYNTDGAGTVQLATGADSYYGVGLANNRDYGVFNVGTFSAAGQIPGGITLGEVVTGSAIGAGVAATNITTPAGVAGAGSRVVVAGDAGVPIQTRTTVNGANTPVALTITTTQPTLAGAWVGDRSNLGYYKRQQSQSFDPTAPNFRGFLTTESTQNVSKNYYQQSPVAPAVPDALVWRVMAKIRLKDMCDFFDKMPLVKGAYLRFIINYNSASHTLRWVGYGGGATKLFAGSSLNQITGGSSPLLLTSGEPQQGANRLIQWGIDELPAAADGTITANFTMAVGTLTLGATQYKNESFNQVRLYVPLYQMNPTMEEQYLSLNRTKKVVYRDIYQYQTNLRPNETFNVLLTNGIPNPKFIICIPMISGKPVATLGTTETGNISGVLQNANPANAPDTCVPCPAYQSCFTTEPATTSPLCAFRDFNIQIAGQNMFIQNELYDFEQYTNELQSVNAINGGLVTGLTSGLISETDFQYLYRYYICDVSRRLPAEDRVPKSVQILGQNLSKQPITLFTYVEFEKEIEIDLITGQKLS